MDRYKELILKAGCFVFVFCVLSLLLTVIVLDLSRSVNADEKEPEKLKLECELCNEGIGTGDMSTDRSLVCNFCDSSSPRPPVPPIPPITPERPTGDGPPPPDRPPIWDEPPPSNPPSRGGELDRWFKGISRGPGWGIEACFNSEFKFGVEPCGSDRIPQLEIEQPRMLR